MQYFKNDLLTVKHGTIVHGCNAQGKMNAGVAKSIRQKYPYVYTNYLSDLHILNPLVGSSSIYRYSEDLVIVSAITQKYYGSDRNTRYVSYDAIDKIFEDLFAWVDRRYAVSMPKIGAGLGGGDWDIISEIILDKAKQQSFSEENLHVYEI